MTNKTYTKQSSEKQPVEAPATWAQLLKEAVAKPGKISEAYSRFYQYSAGNCLLASIQQNEEHHGPINTYKGWQALGRQVKKGAKALILCMPYTAKYVKEDKDGNVEEIPYTKFTYKRNWFFLSDTEGEEYTPEAPKDWSKEKALDALKIKEVPFGMVVGNCQGYAKDGKIAINPLAALPFKTLFHELAHNVLGHCKEAEMNDSEATPKNIREVEAESVALICCESLGLDGAEYARGYIQNWLQGEEIGEKSAQKIFKAADAILKAGR